MRRKDDHALGITLHSEFESKEEEVREREIQVFMIR